MACWLADQETQMKKWLTLVLFLAPLTAHGKKTYWRHPANLNFAIDNYDCMREVNGMQDAGTMWELCMKAKGWYEVDLPEDPKPIILRYDLKPRKGLIIAGSLTLGGVWLIHAGLAGLTGGWWPNYIPLLGPFIAMDYVPKGVDSNYHYAGLAFSGLAQSAGFAMLIAGIVTKHQVPVYALKDRIRVIPLMAPSGSGLALFGYF